MTPVFGELTAHELEAYEIIAKLLQGTVDDGKHSLVIYYPESYLALWRELVRLKAEVADLHRFEVEYNIQLEWNMRLNDKIAEAEEKLKSAGINFQFGNIRRYRR